MLNFEDELMLEKLKELLIKEKELEKLVKITFYVDPEGIITTIKPTL